MHACLLHVYDHALLHLLFIVMKDRSWFRARAILFKQRPIFVMLTSSVRLCCVLHFKSSRMVSSLLADSSL
jgi:hypothetical protein